MTAIERGIDGSGIGEGMWELHFPKACDGASGTAEEAQQSHLWRAIDEHQTPRSLYTKEEQRRTSGRLRGGLDILHSRHCLGR